MHRLEDQRVVARDQSHEKHKIEIQNPFHVAVAIEFIFTFYMMDAFDKLNRLTLSKLKNRRWFICFEFSRREA